MNPSKRLFLLDALALVYRAYYALIRSPRVTSKGQNVNAQFGFTNTLVELLRKENPSHIAVVWDTKAPTERHDDFTDYKANRQAAPEDFEEAIPQIKSIIEGFNIKNLFVDGYEADDIIGTLAWQASDLGYEVYMVTPDKDYGQLVKDNVKIYKPSYKGGGFEILGPKEVCEKWDIKDVNQVVDILGLMGDAVDNIPGIPGVGEKTAAKLLKEYHTLEAVLENAHSIKGALGEKVRNGVDSAIMSKKLATIITKVPIEIHCDELEVQPWNEEALIKVFSELEFKTLAQRLLPNSELATSIPVKASKNTTNQNSLFDDFSPTLDPGQSLFTNYKSIKDVDHEYVLIDSQALLEQCLQEAMLQKEICIDTETTSVDALNAKIVGLSLCWKAHKGYYIPFDINDDEDTKNKLNILKPLLLRQDVLWIAHNFKYDYLVLKNHGVELIAPYFDTLLAHYSLHPEGKQDMDNVSKNFLNYEPIPISQLIGPKGKNQKSMADVPLDIAKEYAVEDTDVTFQLKNVLESKINERDIKELFQDIENPLAVVLAKMESEGVTIDVPFLKKYSEQITNELINIESQIYDFAGMTFNIASPKQLGEILFDHLKLDEKAKKTKTGQYATGEDILVKFKDKHPIINSILDFRELSKLKSTYVDALPQMVNPTTGKIHSSFSQAVVITGRLSSNNPNLQNIPIKTARGREIRKAFISNSEETILLSADYSQIELRIMAAISGDNALIEDFKAGRDIHTATAARIYGVSLEEVTSDMRRHAKSVNFGLIYGQSAFGLSQNLGISRTEAQDIIAQYFNEYSGVKKYMDEIKVKAAEDGFVTTMKGRRIVLKDISSSNATLRSFAERIAINAPIQGSAADMIKKAMIEIDKEITNQKLKSRMILQVHDELVFEMHKSEQETFPLIIKNIMENALPLSHGVPVVAEWGVGENWLDAH